MNKIFFFFLTILFACPLPGQFAFAQYDHHAQQGMSPGRYNYTSFTQPLTDNSPEVMAANAGFETNPETGILYKNAPCTNCYESIGKRTEKNRTFIEKGNPQKSWTQTATDAINYRDDAGNWRAIKTWLSPAGEGIYAATEQPCPVTINTTDGYSSLGKSGEQFQFNKELELVFQYSEDSLVSLGGINWSNHTAGDDGVYVIDAWPGIDMEVHTMRAAIKTNFIIKHAMPEYGGGKLLIRDHYHMESGLSLYSEGGSRFSGVLEVRNDAGQPVYLVSTATAFEKNNGVHTLRPIDYYINPGSLDIAVPGDFLNRDASAYPVIIDPLVSLGTSVTIPGSTYSPGWTTGCATLNAATVPADLTVTDVQFTFEYLASGGAIMYDGALDFTTSTCRSPGTSGYYWTCNTPLAPGSCGGSNISMMSDLSACVPAPQCPSYDLNVTMNMYQSYLTDPPCSNLYITATEPLTITIVGQAFDVSPITASSSTICQGSSTTLSTSGLYGVTPYSYSWSPGGGSGSPITESPSTTTTYTVVATDFCGTTAATSTTITVNPNLPITGTTGICVGTSSTLSDPIAGGTWSSAGPGIASVGSSSGAVSGVSPGTTIISYTNSYGCVATIPVVIATTPSPIAGPSNVCVGNSIGLTDAPAGGTWVSASPGTASVSSSGSVSGLAAGPAVITYSLGPSCYTTTTVTVFGLPVITGLSSTDPTSCIIDDGAITLTGLTPGTPYTLQYLFNGAPQTSTVTANAAGNIDMTGLAAGGYANFSVTDPAGCSSLTFAGPAILSLPPTPPAPVATNSSPVCAGGEVDLFATPVSGATYSWSGPSGYSSASQNPVINGSLMSNNGTYSVTATVAGCTSSAGTTVVVIDPIPAITSLLPADPTTCLGSDGTITLTGLQASVSYLTSWLNDDGTSSSTTLVADAAGHVVITGLSAGTYTDISVSSFSCQSPQVGPATLTDPGAPPVPTVANNSPVCVGGILDLYGADSVQGLSYSWQGPDGYTSNAQNPEIHNVPASAAGTYTVTVSNGACTTSTTTDVSLYPGITLAGVTSSQPISYGSSVHLFASGALFYVWTPDNGSLNNNNISEPVAAPTATTTYTVIGTSIHGCMDSAFVTITVLDTNSGFIPTAFTPNNDGRNDVFRVVDTRNRKLVAFDVFNRWGEMVYHNSTNINDGWDGSWNGQPQDIGVYNYTIILAESDGANVTFKGTVTLLR